MDGGNFWQKLFDASHMLTLDGPYADPNNQTIDYTSAQPEDSQGRNLTDTNLEINGNDHQTLDYLSAQRPNTAVTNLEVNDNNHQALDSLLAQPGSSEFSPNKATTNLEMNDKRHQTFDYLPAQQGSFETPATPCSNNPKRKSPEGSAYLTPEKKRLADKAYRERCRVEKDYTKAENDRLKTEINRLNEECAGKNQALKSQEEENKHLQQKIRRLEGNLSTQNAVVELLTKQLGASQIIDLQRENTSLKCVMDRLMRSVDIQDNLIIRQLKERNEQLQREKSTLETIVEALCLTINNDKDHEEEHKR